MAEAQFYGQLQIGFSRPYSGTGVMATVIVGSNYHRAVARTKDRAARLLRIHLAGLFAYADACRSEDFAAASKARRIAMRTAAWEDPRFVVAKEQA